MARRYARPAARLTAAGWPALLAATLLLVGVATGGGVELRVLLALGGVQLLWLSLWVGLPKLAGIVGRGVGRLFA